MSVYVESMEELVGAAVAEPCRIAHRLGHGALLALHLEPGEVQALPVDRADRFLVVVHGSGYLQVDDATGNIHRALGGGDLATLPAKVGVTLHASADGSFAALLIAAGPLSSLRARADHRQVAEVGDEIILRDKSVGDPDRDGEIVGVGPGGQAPYTVRWSANGHVTVLFPGPGVEVRHLHHA